MYLRDRAPSTPATRPSPSSHIETAHGRGLGAVQIRFMPEQLADVRDAVLYHRWPLQAQAPSYHTYVLAFITAYAKEGSRKQTRREIGGFVSQETFKKRGLPSRYPIRRKKCIKRAASSYARDSPLPTSTASHHTLFLEGGVQCDQINRSWTNAFLHLGKPHRKEHLRSEHSAVADLRPFLEVRVIAEHFHRRLGVRVVSGLKSNLFGASREVKSHCVP